MQIDLDYGTTFVGDLEGRCLDENPQGRPTAVEIRVGDTWTTPTPRFWKSFAHRFHVSENVFRYFEPDEVFGRVAERNADDRVSYCLEHHEGERPRLLAISNPKRPPMNPGQLVSLARRYGGSELEYDEGRLTSVHVPRSGENVFSIRGDTFRCRYVLRAPLDGYGSPQIHLSLLREICANGMVAFTPAFRSDIRVAGEPLYSVERALETFDNDEGFSALRQRFDAAQTSWASLNECNGLYRKLVKAIRRRTDNARLLDRFHRLCGRVQEFYGLANLDALSIKRQRVLPARCRLYDLLNFASEIATHHVDAAGRAILNAWIGSTVSDEYDLENTARDDTEFQDLFCGEDA